MGVYIGIAIALIISHLIAFSVGEEKGFKQYEYYSKSRERITALYIANLHDRLYKKKWR